MSLREKLPKMYDERNLKTDIYPILLFGAIMIIKTIFTNRIYTATAITGADEIGTIASAAFFAGYDWSGVISKNLYYGFGYSIFLAPIFIIFKNSATIHHLLLFSNNILSALGGTICYIILTRFFKLQNRKIAVLIAGITVLYFPVSFAGNILINENMLQLLVWIVLYLLLLLNELEKGTRKNVYTILLSIVLFYSLLVHSRSLVLIAVVIFTELGIYIVARKNIVNPYIFYPVLVIGYFLAKSLIKLVQEKLWLADGSKTLTNSTESLVSGLLGNIGNLFTYTGIKLYFSELLGQIYTMTVLTYGICVIAGVTVVIFLKYFWRKRKRYINNRYYQNGIIIVLYSFMGVVATLLSSSLVALRTAEAHTENGIASKWFLYNRYWSIYMTVVIMLGAYFLYRYRKLAKEVMVTGLLIVLSIAFGFNGYLGYQYSGQGVFDTGVYYPFMAVGFWKPGEIMTDTSFFKVTLIFLLVFCVFMLLTIKKKLNAGYFLIGLVMLVNYAYGTYHISINIANVLKDQFEGVIALVNDCEPEYIYIKGKDPKLELWCQYLFPRYEITCEMTKVEETENIVVMIDDLTDEFAGEDWGLVYYDNDGKYLYEEMYVLVKGDELAETLSSKGYKVEKIDILELTGYFLKPSQDAESEPIGGIVNGIVEQYFYITDEMANSDFQIEVMMATYARENQGTLRVEIVQDDKILTYDINKLEMEDNAWVNIGVYNHGFTEGKALIKIVDLDNDIDNCVTAYTIDTGELGDLYFCNKKCDNKLFMRIKAIE